MASEYYLYCAKTQEAVEVIRRGTNGNNTPQGSVKAQFAFMSYHMSKDVAFTLVTLDSIGSLYEDVQVVEALDELEEERLMHKQNGGDVTLILLWNEANAAALLARESKQPNALDHYHIPSPTLQARAFDTSVNVSSALGEQIVNDVRHNVAPALSGNDSALTGRDLADLILALPESVQNRVAEIDFEGYYATEINHVIPPYIDPFSGNLIIGKVKTVE